MVQRFGLLMSLLVVGLSPPAPAETWTSPDGVLSVSRPDPARFGEIEAQTPLLAIWISDEMTLGVVASPFPRGGRLVRDAVEKGFAEEINGEITQSDVVTVNGHTVLSMTARGSIPGGEEVFVTQRAFAVNGTAYKLMATCHQAELLDHEDLQSFLGSLVIHQEADPEALSGGGNGQGAAGPEDDAEVSVADRWSRRIGGISALVLLVVGAGLVVRKLARRQPPAQTRVDE